MKDIAVSMVTVDRAPQENYLGTTLENLTRGGIWASDRMASFWLCDSGGDTCPQWVREVLRKAEWRCMAGARSDAGFGHLWPEAGIRLPANLNVAFALEAGADQGVPWVLFLEDDIDCCDAFLDSVGLWLDRNAHEGRRVYLFGSNHPAVVRAHGRGQDATDVPLGGFYGTQAFALRSDDARGLAAYLRENAFGRTQAGTQYDLLMAAWAWGRWPEIPCFLAAAPSFVEHIGRQSVIEPRPVTHQFPTWPGREWSYSP